LPVIPYWIEWTLPWVVFALAILLGSVPERTIAIACAMVLANSDFVMPHRSGQMLTLELCTSIATFVLTTAMALRWDRWWLLFAAMISLLMVGLNIAGMLTPVHWWAFGTAGWTFAYLFLASLSAGTWTAWRNRRKVTLADEARQA
jgi:hypothetical protein